MLEYGLVLYSVEDDEYFLVIDKARYKAKVGAIKGTLREGIIRNVELEASLYGKYIGYFSGEMVDLKGSMTYLHHIDKYVDKCISIDVPDGNVIIEVDCMQVRFYAKGGSIVGDTGYDAYEYKKNQYNTVNVNSNHVYSKWEELKNLGTYVWYNDEKHAWLMQNAMGCSLDLVGYALEYDLSGASISHLLERGHVDDKIKIYVWGGMFLISWRNTVNGVIINYLDVDNTVEELSPLSPEDFSQFIVRYGTPHILSYYKIIKYVKENGIALSRSVKDGRFDVKGTIVNNLKWERGTKQNNYKPMQFQLECFGGTFFSVEALQDREKWNAINKNIEEFKFWLKGIEDDVIEVVKETGKSEVYREFELLLKDVNLFFGYHFDFRTKKHSVEK